MKIEIGTQNINQNVDTEKISYSNPGQKDSVRIAEEMAGYSLDISGTVMDNAAYGKEELQSTKDIMQDAGQKDVALQRDYMAVMSNSMSTEDFAALQKEGYSPANTEIETVVTIVDRIKATMAETGLVVEGYNDDLSKDQLSEITGDVTRAGQIEKALKDNHLPVTEENVEQINHVLKQAQNIKPLSEDAVKYMLNHEMEPTVENLYKAEYSTGNGHYNKKSSAIDWEQIKEQVEDIIQKAGFSADEKMMDKAKWIVEKGVPLTAETLLRMDKLDSLTLPMDEEALLTVMAKAVSDGKAPEEASLLQTKSIAEQAAAFIKEAEAISDNALKQTLENKEELNLQNLKKNEEAPAAFQQEKQVDTNPEFLTAKRLLEETRLQMTVEANSRLLRQGISIDTTPLEGLVEELKKAEQDYYRPLFEKGSEDNSAAKESNLSEKIDLYKETNSILSQVRTVPAAILGKLSVQDTITLAAVYKEGTSLKSTYEKAGVSYEALMTAPRADMGDSMKKAFQNVDELLKEMNFEQNETNRKAVRILGYSQSEINRESIEAVRRAEQAVTNVIEKMTPAKTLQMIKEGENPLNTNIYELSSQLNEKSQEEKNEKYSEFLWKLEKNDAITTQERTAFIGVYRLFGQIEKSDGGLIGNVLSSGEPLTLKNLLSAARSNRAAGMNISVDDKFGGLEELVQKGDSISSQIEQYYTSLSQQVYDEITPEKLANANVSMNTTLEAFAEELKQSVDNKESEQKYIESQISEIRTINEVEDYVIQALQNSNQPVTIDNLLAARQLMHAGNTTFGALSKQIENSKNDKKESLKKELENAAEGFTSKEDANQVYESMTGAAKELLAENMENAVQSIDIKEMNLLYKQLSVAAGFAKDENYEVPVQIDGKWTAVNLKIIRNTEDSGKVSATMETEQYGKVAAEFSVSGKQIKGYISGNQEEGLKKLAEQKETMMTALSGQDKTVAELNYIPAKAIQLNTFSKDVSNKEIKTPMKDLYEVAKAFISAIQEKGETTHEN